MSGYPDEVLRMDYLKFGICAVGSSSGDDSSSLAAGWSWIVTYVDRRQRLKYYHINPREN